MQEIVHRVANMLTIPRYEHSLAVAEAAVFLAKTHGISERNAYLAGLLHDYARDLSSNILLKRGGEFGIINLDIEDHFPLLLHGPVGACLVQKDFSLVDPDIVSAIAWHTTGRKDMSPLEKIIYLADYIEPGRKFPGVDKVRKSAEKDLNGALLVALDQSIVYGISQGWPLHPRTVEARNSILLT